MMIFCEVMPCNFLSDFALQILVWHCFNSMLIKVQITLSIDKRSLEIRLRDQQWTAQWPQHYTKCYGQRDTHTTIQDLKFALTNLHNTRAIRISEAFRAFAWVEVIIEPRKTDATIFAWVGVTHVPCGLGRKISNINDCIKLSKTYEQDQSMEDCR